jgi:hypothetical protein
MGKVPPQHTVTVMTVAVTIVAWISTTLAMVMIPQAAYAQQDEGNPSFSSSSFNNCASDQLPVSINGEIQCLRQGECYSEQFEGKEVKHCNFMMSNSDE